MLPNADYKQTWEVKYGSEKCHHSWTLFSGTNSSLPFLLVFQCSAKPDTSCSSGGKHTCFPPLFVFLESSLDFPVVSLFCSSSSLQLVIPSLYFRTVPWNFLLCLRSSWQAQEGNSKCLSNSHNICHPWSGASRYWSSSLNLKMKCEAVDVQPRPLLNVKCLHSVALGKTRH